MELQHPTKSYIVNGRVLQPGQRVEVEDASPNLPTLRGLGFVESNPAPAQGQGGEASKGQGPGGDPTQGDTTPQGAESGPRGGDSETPEQKAAREKAERARKIAEGKAKAKAARDAKAAQGQEGA